VHEYSHRGLSSCHSDMTPAMGNIVKTVSNVLFHGVDIFIWFG
jgi:hypothetical protein